MQRAPCAIEDDEERAETRAGGRPPAAGRVGLPSRTTVNFLLDTALLVVFTALMVMATIVRFVFPVGSADGWSLWGGTLSDWLGWQFNVVALLTLLIVLHLMLHWTWVCGVIANRLSRRGCQPVRFDDGQRTLLGVALLVVLLNVVGWILALAVLTIQSPRF
jgi:hypothetical protein